MSNISFCNQDIYSRLASSAAQSSASNVTRNDNMNTSKSTFRDSIFDRVWNTSNNLNGKHVTISRDDVNRSLIAYGTANGQQLFMNYADNSTDEDPVMRAWGTNSEGEAFETLIHINSVNPNYATPAEMQALKLYLHHQGVLPHGVDVGMGSVMFLMNEYDANEKVDFMQYTAEIQGRTSDRADEVKKLLNAEQCLRYFLEKNEENLFDIV